MRRLCSRMSALVWLIAATLALVAVAGCTRESSPNAEDTITVAFWDDDGVLDLFVDQSSMYLVFLPLVARNADGELEGRLAERWEHSPDYQSWTVHLRQGVRWHDGVPVTAHDVKFTLDLLSGPVWLHTQPNAFTVTVLDDSTYTIEYHHQLADQVGKGSPLDPVTVYYPKHLLGQFDVNDDAYWDSVDSWFAHPVGNGPYRFVHYQPRIMMEFEANPDHYRGKPSIDRVILKFAETWATELLSGNVDVVNFATKPELLAVLGDDRFQAYHSINPRSNRLIAWNLRDELFSDATTRWALTMSINRAELHQILHMPAGLPIYDSPLTRNQYRRGEVPDPLPYDPERARQLLHEAGWRDDDGDGVLERNGRPFRFALLTPSSWPMKGGEAVYIQSQLRQVGIDVEVHTLENSLVVGRMRAGEFDAALTIQPPSFDSHLGILMFFGEESLIGYVNRDVVALLNELQSMVDPDEIDRIHRQLAPFLKADLPVTNLYPGVQTSVATRRVRGLSAPYRTDPVQYMDELWLEAP